MDGKAINSHFFPEILAGGFSRIDGTVAFYQRVNALVSADSVVIDFGAGRGGPHIDDPSEYRRRLSNFKGRVSKVIGLDMDRAVLENPSVDEAFVFDAEGRAPLSAELADIVLSDYTFEHFSDPTRSAGEIDRLLRPGGWICARTPNRFGYIAVANRLFSDRTAGAVLKIAQPERKEKDVFPAFYRLNTREALLRFFPPSRFEHFVYSWDAEPAYTANRRSIYGAFLALQYLTPPALKTMLMIFIRKKSW
jgi:SAM-dependent methyltransferase